jgi:NADH-quinone oxidoreductase subunit J
MAPEQILFLVIAALTLIASVMVVVARRMMHSALWLVLALLGVAIIFAMLDSSFFAVVQVLVYIGAIAILIIFAMMLTRKAMEDVGPQMNQRWWIPLLAVLVIFVGLVLAMQGWDKFGTLLPPMPSAGENIAGLGKALVASDGYMIPFEVTSVLILAGLIGAIYLGTEGEAKKK